MNSLSDEENCCSFPLAKSFFSSRYESTPTMIIRTRYDEAQIEPLQRSNETTIDDYISFVEDNSKGKSNKVTAERRYLTLLIYRRGKRPDRSFQRIKGMVSFGKVIPLYLAGM